jgi:hypothetical protein
LLLRHSCNRSLTNFDTYVAPEPHWPRIVQAKPEMFLTVQGCTAFGVHARGRTRTTAMFEMVTAAMGLVGAGIFLAHAFEGVLSRT